MITCRIEMRSTILVNQVLQINLGKFYKKIQNKQTLKKKKRLWGSVNIIIMKVIQERIIIN